MQQVSPIPGYPCGKRTFADLERAPEGYRAELIDGVLFVAAPPRWPTHAVIEAVEVLPPGPPAPRE